MLNEGLKVGTQVKARCDIDRYPHFVIETGQTGMVVLVEEDYLHVKFDHDAFRPLGGCDEWEDCLIYSLADERDMPEWELEIIPKDPETARMDRVRDSAARRGFVQGLDAAREIVKSFLDVTTEPERRWLLINVHGDIVSRMANTADGKGCH